jgi:predicted XRE-type DNA-binding protein
MTNRKIPIDSLSESSHPSSKSEWTASYNAHEQFKEMLAASPVAMARYNATNAEIEARMVTLKNLRKAQSLTQATMAELLGMDQSEVSRLENRTDLLLSTLRRFVEATGGQLDLVARYPGSEPVAIRFGDAKAA